MILLKMALCEGGEKGLLAKERIQEASQRFFSVGVKSIERKCNELREKKLSEWKIRNAEDFMREEKLSKTTYREGIEEATPEFDLYEPELIEVYIYETRTDSANKIVPMQIKPLYETLKTLKLLVFLSRFERKDETLHLIRSCMKIDEVVFHELLHACGDSCWRGRCDGIIRPNLIGIKAIQQLLNK